MRARDFSIGIVVGFALCLGFILLTGAHPVQFNVTGFGTYSSGWANMPRCPSDTSDMNGGGVCYQVDTGKIVYRGAAIESLP